MLVSELDTLWKGLILTLKFWARVPIQCWSTGPGWITCFLSHLSQRAFRLGKSSACTGKQQPRKADLPCLYTVRRFWGGSASDTRNLLKLLTLLKKKKRVEFIFLFSHAPPLPSLLITVCVFTNERYLKNMGFHHVFNLASILPLNQRLRLGLQRLLVAKISWNVT